MTTNNSTSTTHTHIISCSSEDEIDDEESILSNDDSTLELGSIGDIDKDENNVEVEDVINRCIVLPYYNHKVMNIRQKLLSLVKKHFPSVNMRVAFTTPNDLSKQFPFKVKLMISS